MPFGQHLSTCSKCGNSYICGDCIDFVCPDCKTKETLEEVERIKNSRKKVKTYKVYYTSEHEESLTITTEWDEEELREVIEGGGVVEPDCYKNPPKKVKVDKVEVIDS